MATEIYMLECEDGEVIRRDMSGRKEKMVKGSGGHAWENVNGQIEEEQ